MGRKESNQTNKQNWSYMYLNHIDKHLLFFSLKNYVYFKLFFFYHSLSAEASFFLSPIISSSYFLPLKGSNVWPWHLIWTANVVLSTGVDVSKMRCSMSEFARRFWGPLSNSPYRGGSANKFYRKVPAGELTASRLKMRMCSCNTVRYKHPVYDEKDRRSVMLLLFRLR